MRVLFHGKNVSHLYRAHGKIDQFLFVEMLWVVFSHLAELLNWKGEETTLLVKNLKNQKNPKVLEALL